MADSPDPRVGKIYDGGTWTVDASEYLAYAAATDDPNPFYEGPEAVAPPMYHVRPMIGLMLAMAADPELEIDMVRLVHGEHAMRFLRPMRAGDVLALSGELLGIHPKASGTVYKFALRASVGDEPVLEGETAYFVRAAKKPDGPRRARPKPEEPPPPTWQKIQRVTEDQAVRYAAASGDGNPIHTDEAVAKKAGLPRTILHGLCTLALAVRDVVVHYADGDPARLESVSVRWASPVFPGDQLTLEVWETHPTRLSFRTLGPSGKPVLTNGSAVLRDA